MTMNDGFFHYQLSLYEKMNVLASLFVDPDKPDDFIAGYIAHINPRQVGIMGFSAGGHLASTVATHSKGDAAADFQILFYPVITMEQGTTHKGSRENLLSKKPKRKLLNQFCNEQHVTASTPRAFIVLANDDRAVPPLNSVLYYEELCQSKVPATMHIYPTGGHGFGSLQSFTYHYEMMLELKAWLNSF